MILVGGSWGIVDILGEGGVIAKSFKGFEHRLEQVRMAQAVGETLAKSGHLVIEAGTGVGKSFAYLVPAANLAREKKGRVLVSTFTITLQEQLINKDIPFLQKALPFAFEASLAKGRGNYLCKRRLEFTLRRQQGLFDKFGSSVNSIAQWAQQTKDGSLSDLGFVPDSAVWDAVKSEHGNCKGRKCPFYSSCFYWRARRRLETADIIVANHSLLFSDLVLKQAGASVLPDYKYVIIDEAHNLERVAEEHFGIDISFGRVRFLLTRLYNPRTHKGFLGFLSTKEKCDKAIDIVGRAARESKVFFDNAAEWYERHRNETGGRCFRHFIEDNLSGHLNELKSELTKLAKQTEDGDEKFELVRFVDNCIALSEDIGGMLSQPRDDYVYWVEPAGDKAGTVRLKSAAIDVGPDVKRVLFDRYDSVVMTSATLSSGSGKEKGGFDFFAGTVGLEDFESVRLGSPFDYQKQAVMYIEKDMPEPNET
jgi:ATP-dependent DNA helicase DinG